MSLSYKSAHPAVVFVAKNVQAVARYYGFNARVTSVQRSKAEQERLYYNYKMGWSVLPAAKPGTSAHERGTAIDIVTDNLPALIELMRQVGFKWAGMKDKVHFQL